ncbi:MAG: DUF4190 domain-containing protein [Thermoleophilaceae bacterium]|nr:DUF4190 domain-containing protein [Thermoleophilaceae bacterium]
MESGQTPPEQPTSPQTPAPSQQPIFVPPGHAPPPGYVAYYPAQPGVGHKESNGNATASLIVSGGALGLLIFTVGVLAPLTLIASIVGTVLGHKGKKAAEQNPAMGQKDEAVAGFWMGIAGIVLAALAVIAMIVLIVLLVAYGESNNWDFEDNSTMHDGFNWD